MSKRKNFSRAIQQMMQPVMMAWPPMVQQPMLAVMQPNMLQMHDGTRHAGSLAAIEARGRSKKKARRKRSRNRMPSWRSSSSSSTFTYIRKRRKNNSNGSRPYIERIESIGHSTPAPIGARGHSEKAKRKRARKRMPSRSSTNSSSTIAYIRKRRKQHRDSSRPDIERLESALVCAAPQVASLSWWAPGLTTQPLRNDDATSVATLVNPRDLPGAVAAIAAVGAIAPAAPQDCAGTVAPTDVDFSETVTPPTEDERELTEAVDPSANAVDVQPVVRRRISTKSFLAIITQQEVERLFVASKQSAIPRACASFPEAVVQSAFPKLVHDITAFVELDAERGGEATTFWQPVIDQAYPHLIGTSFREKLCLLCVRTLRNREEHKSNAYQCIEFFSGVGLLTLAHVELNLRCARFDILYGEAHDCLKSDGARAYLDALAYTTDKGLCWFGTQCSSFLGLCRGQSNRRESNGWVGDELRPFVSKGNGMMRLTSLCFFIAWATGATPSLEQPTESSLCRVRPMRTVLEFIPNVRRTTTWLGAFGSPSPKPIQVWHCNEKFVALKQRRPDSVKMSVRLCTEHKREGKRKYSGNKKLLRDSAAYPRDFGRAVARATYADAHG